MLSGICSCNVGRDGSPCKHQFIIWSNHMSKSRNFLPYHLSKEEKRQFAVIATGSALDIDFYEGLHDRAFEDTCSNQIPINNNGLLPNTSQDQNLQPSSSKNVKEACSDSMIEDSLIAEAKEKLKNSFHYLNGLLLNNSEKSIVTGIIKFSEKIEQLPLSKLPTSLHEFGNNVCVASSSLKRKSRNKISVQQTKFHFFFISNK